MSQNFALTEAAEPLELPPGTKFSFNA